MLQYSINEIKRHLMFDISFYYKPVNTDALAQQEFVTPLTQKDQQTLQTIQSFSQN
jgi:hypothetical protein